MEVLVDAWPDYQIVITQPQKVVRALATEYQASHAQDVLCMEIRELKLGPEKNLGTPDPYRFWKGCLERGEDSERSHGYRPNSQ